jgi:hypothetical protein
MSSKRKQAQTTCSEGPIEKVCSFRLKGADCGSEGLVEWAG